MVLPTARHSDLLKAAPSAPPLGKSVGQRPAAVQPQATPCTHSLVAGSAEMPSDGAPPPPPQVTKGEPKGRYMADSFSDSGMRDTASDTRADVGSEASQKGREVKGARVHVSGTPAEAAGDGSSRMRPEARRKRPPGSLARCMAGEVGEARGSLARCMAGEVGEATHTRKRVCRADVK